MSKSAPLARLTNVTASATKDRVTLACSASHTGGDHRVRGGGIAGQKIGVTRGEGGESLALGLKLIDAHPGLLEFGANLFPAGNCLGSTLLKTVAITLQILQLVQVNRF